jgi:hypothetical protein
MSKDLSKAANVAVTSHVGRDLIASAAAFKNEAAVVWEYVVNSLEYVDRGIQPRVQVLVNAKEKTIEITDNGRGMDRSGLEHYFTMHGENRDRLAGRPGRGKFGTGKSAAFGIAKLLRIDTRHNGSRNVVELTRGMVDSSTGREIPVRSIVIDEPTDEPNGTIVTIGEIELPKVNTPAIIDYIERNLQFFRAKNPEVAVNSHVCSFREPQLAKTHQFNPSGAVAALIGDVVLTVRVARAPLPDLEQGIAITAGPGNLVAIERAGMEKKEFGNYLFGEVDVPRLETHATSIQPYDASRSLQMNPMHPVSAALVGFIGSKLEEVRVELVSEAREARKTEQARRLANEASKLSKILNDDFLRVKQRLRDIQAVSSVKGSASATFGNKAAGGSDPTSWVKGAAVPGVVPATGHGNNEGTSKGRRPPKIAIAGEPAKDGKDAVDPAGQDGNRKKPQGGFWVDFRNLGAEERRSNYDPTTLAIVINLDHPVVAAALAGGSVEDVGFKRLSYEIAFTEYSLALAYEMANEDPEIPADDLLFELRDSLNRVSRSAAALYH